MKALIRFGFTGGLRLNLLITWLVVDVARLWYGFALMAIVVAIPLLTYLLSRFWVFVKH